MAIAGKVAITPKGEWNNIKPYEKLDAVSYNNGMFIAKKASVGIIPEDGEIWMLGVQSVDMAEFEKIIDGTIVVGEAKKTTKDSDGNIIVDTYAKKDEIPDAVEVKGDAETSYRTGKVNLTPADLGALATNGDSKSNIVTYESSDVVDADVEEWTVVDKLTSKLTHATLFGRISQMFKNVRYLYKLLGTTDISDIGDGTISGALSVLNSNLSDIGVMDSSSITTASSYITNVEAYLIKIGKLTAVNIRFKTINEISAGATLFQNLPNMEFTNQTLEIVNIANFSKGTVKLTGNVSLSSVDKLLSGATYIITGLYISW